MALGVLMGVFVMNASPYVTVSQARSSDATDIHVVGEIERGSLVSDLQHGQIRFTLKDNTGLLPVVYTGQPVSDLGSATKVVAIGNMKQGQLQSNQLLIKCPSKYESTPAKA